MIFLILVSCKNKASTKIPLIIAICFAILEQFRVILNFVLAGQAGRVRCIVICINSTPSQMIDGTEKLFEVCKQAARYNESKKFIKTFYYHNHVPTFNLTLASCWRFAKRTIGQARIHTGYHCFTEIGRIFHNKKAFQVEIWKMLDSPCLISKGTLRPELKSIKVLFIPIILDAFYSFKNCLVVSLLSPTQFPIRKI